jgi:hypothetical protein
MFSFGSSDAGVIGGFGIGAAVVLGVLCTVAASRENVRTTCGTTGFLPVAGSGFLGRVEKTSKSTPLEAQLDFVSGSAEGDGTGVLPLTESIQI